MRRYVAVPVGGLGVGDPGPRGLPSPPAELPPEPPAVTYWEPVGPRQYQGLGAGAALSPCGGAMPIGALVYVGQAWRATVHGAAKNMGMCGEWYLVHVKVKVLAALRGV